MTGVRARKTRAGLCAVPGPSDALATSWRLALDFVQQHGGGSGGLFCVSYHLVRKIGQIAGLPVVPRARKIRDDCRAGPSNSIREWRHGLDAPWAQAL